MKKFSLHRGFTLVELMIVIAIIGILAAVLYPSMTGYLEKTRDSNRAKALANVQLWLGTYQVDNWKYPAPSDKTTDFCVSELKSSLATYVASLPTDPRKDFGVTNPKNCTKLWGYAYRLLWTSNNVAKDAAAYVLAARMETKAKANIESTKFWSGTTVDTMNTAISNGYTATGSSVLPYYAIVN